MMQAYLIQIVPILLLATSSAMIVLILAQRGNRVELAGARSKGCPSEFRPADRLARITINLAAFWIILSAAAVRLL